MPERIQLRLVSSNTFEIGDRVRGRLKALPLPASVSPGSFDFQRSAWFKKNRRNRLRGREIYEGQTTQTV